MRRGLVAVALVLALAGCKVGGPHPEPEGPLPPGVAATAQAIGTPRGPLSLTVWEPEGSPRALLLALHGYGETAETAFGTSAPGWAERGVLVYAPDQRGFGRNPSNRRWPGPEALVEDAEAVAAEVAARHPDLPLTVLGFSMGGAVALAAAGEGRLPEGTRLILLAPGLWGGDQLGPLYRAGAWGAAAVIPDRRFSAEDSPRRIRPTDNWAELRRISEDPARFADPSPRELLGLIRLMDRALAAAPGAPAGTLTVMGAHDEVVPVSAVRAGHGLLPDPKDYVEAPEGWHMLLIDLNAQVVRDLVAERLLEGAR